MSSSTHLHIPIPGPSPSSNPLAAPTATTARERAILQSIHKLICIEMQSAGFSHFEDTGILDSLTALLLSLCEGLIHLAREMTALTGKSAPNVRDFLAACQDQGLATSALEELMRCPTRQSFSPPTLSKAQDESPNTSLLLEDPVLNFLPSESETDDEHHANATATNRIGNHRKRPRRISAQTVGGYAHLPDLPPRHTWMRTVVRVPMSSATWTNTKDKATHSAQIDHDHDHTSSHQGPPDPNDPPSIDLLDRRIRNTRLVEVSLRHLLGHSNGQHDHPREREEDRSLAHSQRHVDGIAPVLDWRRGGKGSRQRGKPWRVLMT